MIPTHKNFFMVPNRIFDLNLKPRELAVYCCLLRHCDDNMTCYPSRKLIGTECSIDRKTVDLALKNLKKIGLIEYEHRHRSDGSATSNLYHVANLLEPTSEWKMLWGSVNSLYHEQDTLNYTHVNIIIKYREKKVPHSLFSLQLICALSLKILRTSEQSHQSLW